MTDIRLDDVDGTYVVLSGRVVRAATSDLELDATERRRGGGPLRRALVHDPKDGLTINYAADYPGGVTIAGPVHLDAVTVAGPLQLDQAEITPKGGHLLVHGAIAYEMTERDILTGGFRRVAVDLHQALTDLRGQVAKLNERVAALEARLNA